MDKLKDKWALVTGASRGVGLRVAKALAAEGCRMLVHARTLDILYNNAGLGSSSKDIYTIPASDYSKSFQVNCIAPAKLCDAFLPSMLKQNWGSNVLMNLLDPGWLRTDMGGSAAPNNPDTVLPGALVPVRLDKDAGSGTLYAAQDYRE